MSYDLNIGQGLSPTGDNKMTFAFAGSTGGARVSGPVKLSQRLLMLFLTEKGTVFSDPAYGNEFLNLLYSGQLRTEVDVLLHFNLAALDLLAQLKTATPANAPLDEQIDTLELEEHSLNQGYLSMRMKMTTLAGSSRQITLPVRTLGV